MTSARRALNIAVVPPIPVASVMIAIAAKARDLSRARKASRRSESMTEGVIGRSRTKVGADAGAFQEENPPAREKLRNIAGKAHATLAGALAQGQTGVGADSVRGDEPN